MTDAPDTDTLAQDTQAESSRCLDDALEDSFPASDPPSMTSPTAATPADDTIADGPGGAPMRVYRVIDAAQAAEPFAPQDSGGRWSPPGTACVYASLSPASALLEYLAHLEGEPPASMALIVNDRLVYRNPRHLHRSGLVARRLSVEVIKQDA